MGWGGGRRCQGEGAGGFQDRGGGRVPTPPDWGNDIKHDFLSREKKILTHTLNETNSTNMHTYYSNMHSAILPFNTV